MRCGVVLVLGVLAMGGSAWGQSVDTVEKPTAAEVDESYQPSTEHPRLLLTKAKLRLLRRERERQSARWLQFEVLMRGRAQMPEPGFAQALYYQVTGERRAATDAIDWALKDANDIRQQALVLDWCQPALSAEQRRALVNKLKTALARRPGADPSAMRARVFAAIAMADEPDAGPVAPVLEQAVTSWWRKQTAPAWKSGKQSLSREQLYALLETLHAVRDNLNIDLRDNAGKAFAELPSELLLSYYPAIFPAPENDYRVPVYDGNGDPDLRTATISRVLELAIVGYDPNMRSSQFLQGWLMHDKFVLRGPYGAPYEFLWANPYLPGLSFYHMPLFFHDERRGELYARSSWDDDARWVGYRRGRAQVFQDGKRYALDPASARAREIDLGDLSIVAGSSVSRLDRKPDQPPTVFVIGLKPRSVYAVEIDDEELAELTTDAGGILPLPSGRTDARMIQIRERAAQ